MIIVLFSTLFCSMGKGTCVAMCGWSTEYLCPSKSERFCCCCCCCLFFLFFISCKTTQDSATSLDETVSIQKTNCNLGEPNTLKTARHINDNQQTFKNKFNDRSSSCFLSFPVTPHKKLSDCPLVQV